MIRSDLDRLTTAPRGFHVTHSPAFSDRGRRVVVIVAVLSLLGWTAAALWGARLAEPEARGRDSYGRGPLGHRAFVDVLDEVGFQVTRTRDVDGLTAAVPLLLVEPDAVRVELAGRTIDLAALVADRARRAVPTVVVLSKWRLVDPSRATAEDPAATQAVLHAAMPGARLVPAPLSVEPTPATLGGALGVFRAEPQGLQTIVPPPGAIEWLRGVSGTVIAQMGGVVVVSEPDLLHNFDVQRGDHARLFTQLFAGPLRTDAVMIDEIFHGHGLEPSLGAALGRFPAVLLVLHALLLAFAAAARGLRRFGPIRPEALVRGPRERVGIAASVLASGQRPSLLAATYVRRLLDEIGHLVGPLEGAAPHPTGRDAEGLAEELDAAARRRGIPPDAKRLLARAVELEDARRDEGDAALRLARFAWTFHERMVRRGRPPGRRDRDDSPSEAA
jgi:hypothetical protein